MNSATESRSATAPLIKVTPGDASAGTAEEQQEQRPVGEEEEGEEDNCAGAIECAHRRDKVGMRRSECRVLVGVQPPESGSSAWHLLFVYADERTAQEGSSYLHEVKQSLSVAQATSAPCSPQDMLCAAITCVIRGECVDAVKMAMRVVRFDHNSRLSMWLSLFDVALCRRGCSPLLSAALSAAARLHADHDAAVRDASAAEEPALRRRYMHAADVCVAKATAIICMMRDDAKPLLSIVRLLQQQPFPPLLSSCEQVAIHRFVREAVNQAVGADESLSPLVGGVKQVAEICVSSLRRSVVTSTVRAEELPTEHVFIKERSSLDPRHLVARTEECVVAVDVDKGEAHTKLLKRGGEAAPSAPADRASGGRQRVVVTRDEAESTGVASLLHALSLTLQSIALQEEAVRRVLGAARESEAPGWCSLFLDGKGKPSEGASGMMPFALALCVAACDVMRTRGIHMRCVASSSAQFSGPCKHFHALVDRDMVQMEHFFSGKVRDCCSNETLRSTYAACKDVLGAAYANARMRGEDARATWDSSPRSAAWSLILEANRADPCAFSMTVSCVSLCSRGVMRNHALAMILCLNALNMRSAGGGRWFDVSPDDAVRISVLSQLAQGDDTAFDRLGPVASDALAAVPPQLSRQGTAAKCRKALRSSVGLCPRPFYQACRSESLVCFVEQLEQCGADVLLVGRVCGAPDDARSADDTACRHVEVFGRRIALGSAYLASCSNSRAARATCLMQSTLHGAMLAYQRSVFVNVALLRCPGSGNQAHALLAEEREAYEEVMHGSSEQAAVRRVNMMIVRERQRNRAVRSMAGIVATGDDRVSDADDDDAERKAPEFPEAAISRKAVAAHARAAGRADERGGAAAEGDSAEYQHSSEGNEDEGTNVIVVQDRNFKLDPEAMKLNAPLIMPSSKLFCMKELERRGHKFRYDRLSGKKTGSAGKAAAKAKATQGRPRLRKGTEAGASAVSASEQKSEPPTATVSTRIFMQRVDNDSEPDSRVPAPCVHLQSTAADGGNRKRTIARADLLHAVESVACAGESSAEPHV